MKQGQQQLNSTQRSQLLVLLKVKKSLSDVAQELNVSRQTIYREIKRNGYERIYDTLDIKYSCIYLSECRKKAHSSHFFCSHDCSKYERGINSCLKKYPFICNYCKKNSNHICRFLHFFYDSQIASDNYHNRISIANQTPRVSSQEIKKIDKIVSPLIKKGQSVEAILMNHPEIKQSPLTIRNWIKKNYLSCKLSELRMTGRRIPSKQYDYSKKHNYTILSEAKLGHKYSDYRYYLSNHPNALIVQLDTVIGVIDGKYSVLTIHIVNYKFQFGILLNEHTKDEVFNKLNELFNKLKEYEDKTGIAMYSTFTEILLTDNGPEFDSLLEFCNQNENIHVFYCHPLSSFEKGACERNHELIRYIHYKGWSFDDMTQEDVNIIFSNINSYPRKSLNKKTPYECVLSNAAFGKEFLDLININKVDCDDVILNPSLLRKIKK